MVVRCPHGHENDPRNRFCEQCGARLEHSAPREEASQPGVAGSIRCRSCGASATPGEAFCDTCGASLAYGVDAPASGYDSYDAPTVFAPTPPGAGATAAADRTVIAQPSGQAGTSDAERTIVAPPGGAGLSQESDRTIIAKPGGAGAAQDDERTVVAPSSGARAVQESEQTLVAPPGMSLKPAEHGGSGSAPPGDRTVCAVCGYQNMPGDSFCDNCGVALTASDQAPAAGAGAPDMLICNSCGTSNDPANMYCEQCGAALKTAHPPTGEVPVESPQSPASSPIPPAEEQPAVGVEAEPPARAAMEPTAPAEVAQPTQQPAATGPTSPEPDEEEQLNQAVARERENVAMFEQMAARYAGTTPPPYVTAGLEEARRALAEAESRLAALREARARRPDPAEVSRLEDAINRERENVAMFEQMAARYAGTTPPPYVTAGLEEARRALAEAEMQLMALTSGQPAAPAAPSAQPPTPAAPPTVAESPAPVEMPAPPSAQEPVPVAAEQPTAPAGNIVATLIVEGSNARIHLQADKQEFTIGREDPVSGIFPEVDMTPHGGEAGGVSRQHARLTRDGDRWLLIDLESTNYTKVNGTKLQPHTPTPIADGARLQFGRLAVTFHTGQA
ncbi:MAG: hypothetical protein KatS3mg057_0414 [Herpetosiphonaceae bacterium]|nr:MAG: hypothetical protein KatS3mg057_0414 [Herpetosiphonaceae bacterium]